MSLSPISFFFFFHRASVPDSLCEVQPLVETEARGGNGRGAARWTDASCWRWHSASARPHHVLQEASWFKQGNRCLRQGMLAASQRPAGLRGGVSELMGQQGTHASALCSGIENRPKSEPSKF